MEFMFRGATMIKLYTFYLSSCMSKTTRCSLIAVYGMYVVLYACHQHQQQQKIDY